ncbi:helix-turn-helix domain-containing protein [Streptomyces sp. NPDC001502]|uniref:helix-turn-helix domain-containing protein n=1 Tax=Streptomyces sp. NPDC001502 TaxID=3364578 RepID=UPI00369268E9
MPATRTRRSKASPGRKKQTAQPTFGLPRQAKGSHLSAKQRAKFTDQIVSVYTGKQQGSIRQIAAATGPSYGMIHRLLSQAGIPLRGRGGRRAATAPGEA